MFTHSGLAARHESENVARAPPPGLLSSVFIHTVNQVIVQGDEVADQGCGAQTWALTPWQENLKVTVDIQIPLAQISRDLYLTCMIKFGVRFSC